MEGGERVAVFIVRAELPDDAVEFPRARVTWRTRLDTLDTEHVSYTASRSGLHALLDRWLDESLSWR